MNCGDNVMFFWFSNYMEKAGTKAMNRFSYETVKEMKYKGIHNFYDISYK